MVDGLYIFRVEELTKINQKNMLIKKIKPIILLRACLDFIQSIFYASFITYENREFPCFFYRLKFKKQDLWA